MMELPVKMLNKRGMSPLIATILLVSVAVALGASIVSYAGVYFEKTSLNKSMQCKDYVVNLFELDKTQAACASKFKTEYAIRFDEDGGSASETSCYMGRASGTSRICNAGQPFSEGPWVRSEDLKI